MLAISRLPGSAAAFIAALASYRPMPTAPAPRPRADRRVPHSAIRRRSAEATARPDRPQRPA